MEYHPVQFKNTWIRVAGIAKRIRELDPPPHWRFEVAHKPDQYPINDWHIIDGVPSVRNNQPGTDPTAKEPALLAWIAYYVQVITVDQAGRATIVLGEPPAGISSPWATRP